MSRILKVCNDPAKLLELINQHLALTPHHSWCLGSDLERMGCYWKIGGIKVRDLLLNAVLEHNNIKLAEHYATSYRATRDKIYNWRKIKSRFGETKVVYYVLGRPKYSDNQQAMDFYGQQHDGDIKKVVDVLHSGTVDALESAKAVKKQLRAEGRL